MCEAGRIKHHLKHNLWRPESTILFCRLPGNRHLRPRLAEGASQGEAVRRGNRGAGGNPKLAGTSGHADNNGLMEWISISTPNPKAVFVTHGDDSVCDLFAGRLKDEFHLDAFAPYPGAQFDLMQNQILRGQPPENTKRTKTSKTQGQPGLSAAFVRRAPLMDLIQRSQGRANKDMAKLTDQINSMCDKWE